jgi:primosomal protein N' (replication factor Y) (superfamily II helicase)
VSLLIPTHALPSFSYRVPEHLGEQVRVGTAVVAPLSGYPRLGVVVALERENGARALEDLRSIAEGLSLPAQIVDLCRWASEAVAVPLSAALRAALPPGLGSGRYRILDPAPGWPWKPGSLVGRTALRRILGGDGLLEAEANGRLEFAPMPAQSGTVEWVMAVGGADPDLSRAPTQRRLFELLRSHPHGRRTSTLLSEAGCRRATLRELVRRGAVRLEKRPKPPAVFTARGHGRAGRRVRGDAFAWGAGRVLRRGGAWLWRTPTQEQPAVVAALAGAAAQRGEQVLILAPEIETVEHLTQTLLRRLPAGRTVAAYHSGMGRDRAAIYRAACEGAVEVVVGTRAAALLPMARLRALCVVDEPNEAHRAEPGYEGIPVHVRDLALERGRIEDAGILCLSPFPSLRLRSPAVPVRELPARPPRHWPSVRIVDLRGSGATLSSTLMDECRKGTGRVGVVANRLGYATSVSCGRCGAVRSCPECNLPLALHDDGALICHRCAFRERSSGRCAQCGSERLISTGLGVERVRAEISTALDESVGLLTAACQERADARVVVGTARCVLGEEWDSVLVPDADALLLGSSMGVVERAFRLLFRAAETARTRLLVQTRVPEHYALRAALRGDYPAFAAAELPRLRSLNYPPFAHLAAVTFEGPEEEIRRAVESMLRPALAGVEASEAIPLARSGRPPAWRVLLRSEDRAAVARAGALAARLAAQHRGPTGLKVRVDVDPEEV